MTCLYLKHKQITCITQSRIYATRNFIYLLINLANQSQMKSENCALFGVAAYPENLSHYLLMDACGRPASVLMLLCEKRDHRFLNGCECTVSSLNPP